MNPALRARVREFLAEQTAVPSSRIGPKSTIFGDLGVYGDDAVDLLRTFAEVFSVDTSEFDFSRHFPPESLSVSALVKSVLFAFRAGTPEERLHLEPITAEDLARAAGVGRWSYSSSEATPD